jgi:HK97 family phage major capsid protein
MDLTDVKAAIDAQNRAFEEFKTTNNQRLKEIAEKGVADPLIEQKLEKLNAELDKHSRIVDAFAALEGKVNKLARFGAPGEDKAGDELKAFNIAIRAFATEKGRPIPAELTAEEYRAYRTGFDLYIRCGPDAANFDRRAMSVGSDPDGGYLVLPDMGGRFVKRRFDLSPIRQIAAVQGISTDKLEGLADTTDLTGGGWVGETASRAATATPTLKRWEVPVHEQFQNPGVTQKLLDDASVDVEAMLMDKVADKMARTEGAAFVVGSGVNQPRGFASYTTAATADSSRMWGVLEHVNTGANGSFGTAPNGSNKLIDLVHALKPGYRQNARFCMPRVTLGAVRQLQSNSQYIWLPSMEAGQPSTLLSYPITEVEDLVAYTTTGALGIAFGDFAAGYQIVDRLGIRMLRDPYTNKPYVQFYTTARVGGDVIDFEAIKFLKFS